MNSKHIMSPEESLIFEWAKCIACKEPIEAIQFSHQVDWDVIFRILKQHKLLPLLESIADYIPEKYQAFQLAQREIQKMMIQVRMQEYHLISQAFKQDGIEIIWIKGIPLSQLLYNDIYARDSSDMDFLIAGPHFEKAYNILKQMGYRQKLEYNQQTERLEVFDSADFKFIGDYHELSCVKEIYNRIYLSVELKRASSGVDVHRIKSFYQNVMVVPIGTEQITTINYEHTFIHLCANAYGNCEYYGSKPVLRDFIDICAFHSRYGNLIHWETVASVCENCNLSYMVAWCLRQTNLLWNTEIFTAPIIQLFSPNNFMPQDPWLLLYEQDGSMTNWRTPLKIRLFDWHLHKTEQIASYKEHLYSPRCISSKPCYEIEIEREAPHNILTFFVPTAQWTIKYRLLCLHEHICMHIEMDKAFKDNIKGSKLEVTFVDNNPQNDVHTRYIRIWSEDNQTITIASEHIGLTKDTTVNYDHSTIDIYFELNELNMNLITSNQYIAFNIVYYKTIVRNAYKDVTYLSGSNIPLYLHLDAK